MGLFKTKAEFVNYLFSLQYEEPEFKGAFVSWPTGAYSLSDIIGYIETFSEDECAALMSDMFFKAQKLEIEKLESEWPQEIFFYKYKESLQESKIRCKIMNDYPVAGYVLDYIEQRLLPKELADVPEQDRLPPELDTPEALRIFEHAQDLGLIDRDYNYKWLKGLQLLACFAREMSLKLGLGKGNNSDGTPRISWQPFERLFDIPNGKLRANYNDVQKTGQEPSDHKLIDMIFK